MKAYADPARLIDIQLKVYDFYKQKYSQEYLDNEETARNYLTDLGLDL
jgi:hypothetical protein